MEIMNGTPKRDGFYVPSEHEWHEGCWMLWPDKRDTFRLGGVPAQHAYANVAKAIADFERVTVCVNHAQYANACTHLIHPNIRIIEMSSNDAWMRDIGPTFVINNQREVRGIDWTFNAYGGLVDGLYFPWDKDNMVARKVCETSFLDCYRLLDFVIEGGAFQTDGEGTVVVTEECLLGEGRNPHLTRAEMEDTLKEYLGIETVIWLKRGLFLDETNGHVDNLFCFVRPGVALLAWTDDAENPQYEVVHDCYDILSSTQDAKGRTLEIHKVPLPAPLRISQEEADGIDHVPGSMLRNSGDLLAASYVNLYIANGAIVFPIFDDPNDEVARTILAQQFPRRTIIGIHAREIFLGGGGIHSITLQQPRLS